MKYLISLFVFLVMGSVSSASIVRLGGKLIGRTEVNMEMLKKLKSNINRRIGVLLDEKSVPEIIRDVLEDPNFINFAINPVDVAALLYSRTIIRLHLSELSGVPGQKLENIRMIRDSLDVAFGPDDNDVRRMVQIGDTEFETTLPVGVKKLKIGDFEFEIKEILSSFFFIRGYTNARDFFDITGDPRLEEYILMNLSDFTQEGAEVLIRFWDRGGILQRELPKVFERHHLVNNPLLVFKWFKEGVEHYQRDIMGVPFEDAYYTFTPGVGRSLGLFVDHPGLIEEYFKRTPEITKGFGLLDRLNGFIRSGYQGSSPEDVEFWETILFTAQQSEGFSNYVNYLLGRIGRETTGGRLNVHGPE